MTKLANNDISRPHTFQQGTSSRTLLLLHGTGGDEFDLINLGKAIDPEASYLSPRGMHLESGMNRFFERYPDGSFNEESIDVAVQELAGFVQAAVASYGIDPINIFGVGFSNGANTLAALMVSEPDLLFGAALFGSTKPYASVAAVNLTGKKIWLANGDQDSYAPISVSQSWTAELKDFGADVTWLRHAGGHQISAEHVVVVAKGIAEVS